MRVLWLIRVPWKELYHNVLYSIHKQIKKKMKKVNCLCKIWRMTLAVLLVLYCLMQFAIGALGEFANSRSVLLRIHRLKWICGKGTIPPEPVICYGHKQICTTNAVS